MADETSILKILVQPGCVSQENVRAAKRLLEETEKVGSELGKDRDELIFRSLFPARGQDIQANEIIQKYKSLQNELNKFLGLVDLILRLKQKSETPKPPI